jgi:hypothetical protein
MNHICIHLVPVYLLHMEIAKDSSFSSMSRAGQQGKVRKAGITDVFASAQVQFRWASQRGEVRKRRHLWIGHTVSGPDARGQSVQRGAQASCCW